MTRASLRYTDLHNCNVTSKNKANSYSTIRQWWHDSEAETLLTYHHEFEIYLNFSISTKLRKYIQLHNQYSVHLIAYT